MTKKSDEIKVSRRHERHSEKIGVKSGKADYFKSNFPIWSGRSLGGTEVRARQPVISGRSPAEFAVATVIERVLLNLDPGTSQSFCGHVRGASYLPPPSARPRSHV